MANKYIPNFLTKDSSKDEIFNDKQRNEEYANIHRRIVSSHVNSRPNTSGSKKK